MKIKIEDMEFELDDYRTGKINKKVRNLTCIDSTGYNYNKRNNENDKTKTVNNINKSNNNNNNNNAKCIYNNMEKSIYVNSKNNNYLITKLKKENENLRLIISEYENNLAKLKMKEKKVKQKKIDNINRLARKIINNRQPSITKSSNNILNNMSNINNFNNTYTTNFYHVKARNKFSTNTNNSSKVNESNINSNNSNVNQSNINSKILPMHSYIIHNSKIVKSRTKKSLSVFHSSSKNKSKKEKNDKNKNNFKKISNINNNIDIIGEDNDSNIIEIKIKEKNNPNNANNSRMHTVNNNNNVINNINISSKGQSSKNVFSWKKKVVPQKRNVEISMQYNTNNTNTCTTERRKTETNNSQSNSNIISPATNNTNRNSGGIFIPKKEFNLTWSRFPRKDVETSFDNYRNRRNIPSVIMSSKDFKKNEKISSKFISKAASKNRNRNSMERFDNSHTKEKNDSTPQKITINRKIISNKVKGSKNFIENNNASMKNITNMNHKNKKSGFYDNKANDQNVMNISASNKMFSFQLSNLHKNEIYCHKKRNSLLGIGLKNISNDNTNDSILKKNSYVNSKYNVTINNINNCNYYNLIQGANKPGIKIKKKISKNN